MRAIVPSVPGDYDLRMCFECIFSIVNIPNFKNFHFTQPLYLQYSSKFLSCKLDMFFLSRHHSMTEWNVYEDVHAIIDQGVNATVDDEVCCLS